MMMLMVKRKKKLMRGETAGYLYSSASTLKHSKSHRFRVNRYGRRVKKLEEYECGLCDGVSESWRDSENSSVNQYHTIFRRSMPNEATSLKQPAQ